MKILSIESSCDETSIAVIEDGKKVLSNVTYTQIDIHKMYGGVVPEVASRHHIEKITYVLDSALKDANLTMNDIDRSVESMDFAFRRRFAFQEITAEDTMDSILYKLGDDMNDAVNKMRAINSTLDTLGLNSNYHIGAAYFKKVENYENKSNKWNDLWNLHLKGTLFEYFRGEPDADNKIEQLKDAYDNVENNK